MSAKKNRRECNKEYYDSHKQERLQLNREWRKTHKAELSRSAKRFYYSPKGAFSNYKSVAKKKGLSWELSFEQFMSFWQQPCFYCGVAIETIGLDRIDSEKGYVVGNLLPCCWIDNRAKGTLSFDGYLTHCRRLATHLQRST